MTIPSLYLFLSWLIATFPKNYRQFVKVLLVLAMLITLTSQTVSSSSPIKENYQAAVNYISQKAGPQDAIVLTAPFTIYPVEYYYKGSAALETLPPWNRFSSGSLPVFSVQALPAEVGEVNSNYSNIYLLLSYDQGYNETIRLYYDTHFQRIDQQNFSSGLSLWVYKIKY